MCCCFEDVILLIFRKLTLKLFFSICRNFQNSWKVYVGFLKQYLSHVYQTFRANSKYNKLGAILQVICEFGNLEQLNLE